MAALAVVIGFCGANVKSHISIKEFRQLPQSKRLRLERNLDDYLKLSEADKLRYWEMHQQVEEHHLTPLMENYEEWLSTLSPFDRQLLRTTTEPAAKIAEVEKILKAQRKLKEHRLPELIARIIKQKKEEELDNKFNTQRSAYRILNFFFSNRPELDYSNLYVFSEDQLKIILDEILLQQLSSSQRGKLEADSSQGIDKMIHILEAALHQSNNPKLYWPSPATVKIIEEAFSLKMFDADKDKRPDNRHVVNEVLSRNKDKHKRLVFRRTLIRSMMVYEMQQFAKKSPVTHKELLNFFKTLDTSKQHALLNSPFDYQAEALKWTYIWEKHHTKSIFSDDDFTRKVLQVMDPRPSGHRSGPGRHVPGGKDGKPLPLHKRGHPAGAPRSDRLKDN